MSPQNTPSLIHKMAFYSGLPHSIPPLLWLSDSSICPPTHPLLPDLIFVSYDSIPVSEPSRSISAKQMNPSPFFMFNVPQNVISESPKQSKKIFLPLHSFGKKSDQSSESACEKYYIQRQIIDNLYTFFFLFSDSLPLFTHRVVK